MLQGSAQQPPQPSRYTRPADLPADLTLFPARVALTSAPCLERRGTSRGKTHTRVSLKGKGTRREDGSSLSTVSRPRIRCVCLQVQVQSIAWHGRYRKELVTIEVGIDSRLVCATYGWEYTSHPHHRPKQNQTASSSVSASARPSTTLLPSDIGLKAVDARRIRFHFPCTFRRGPPPCCLAFPILSRQIIKPLLRCYRVPACNYAATAVDCSRPNCSLTFHVAEPLYL